MVITHDVDKAMDDQGEKPFIKMYPCPGRLVGGTLHGDDNVPYRLFGHAVKIREGDHVRGAVLIEKVAVDHGDPFVVHKEDAQVPILKP